MDAGRRSPHAAPPLDLTGLTNGTTYWFPVSSLDLSGPIPRAASRFSRHPVRQRGPPPTPTSVTAAASADKVTVSWDAVVDDGVGLRRAARCVPTGPSKRYDYADQRRDDLQDTGIVAGETYW